MRKQLATLATRYKVPAIYQYRPFAAAGGLMSYGSDETEYYHLVGIFTGRILKGARSSTIRGTGSWRSSPNRHTSNTGQRHASSPINCRVSIACFADTSKPFEDTTASPEDCGSCPLLARNCPDDGRATRQLCGVKQPRLPRDAAAELTLCMS